MEHFVFMNSSTPEMSLGSHGMYLQTSGEEK